MSEREPFSMHLQRPLAKGRMPRGALTGAAGGAACGDIIRISLALDERDPLRRDPRRGLRRKRLRRDARGRLCNRRTGARARSCSRRRTHRCAGDRCRARRALALASATPQSLPATRSIARSVRRRARHASQQFRGRMLVAMSGGVDSAVAAHLSCAQQREAVAVTLELWADPENDGERSCCSAQAVRGARALAHSLGMPALLARPARGVPGRRGRALACRARRAGSRPYPCVRCNGNVRLDGMLELAARLGAQTPCDRPLRAPRPGADSELPLLRGRATARRTRATCLPRSSRDVACASALPARRALQGRGPRPARAAGLAVSRKAPTPRTSASSPAPGASRRSSRGTAASETPQGAILDQQGAGSASHARRARLHGRAAPRPRDRRAAEPLYVLATDAARTRSRSGRATALATSGSSIRDVSAAQRRRARRRGRDPLHAGSRSRAH